MNDAAAIQLLMWLFVRLPLYLILCSFVASAAGRRGYSRLLWLFIAFFSFPLAAAFTLASLPDASREERRQRFVDWLRREMAQRGKGAEVSAIASSNGTISDLQTLAR
jgi:hypothetical protein